MTEAEKGKSGNDAKGSLIAVAKVIFGNGSYVGLGFLANVISANGLTPAQFGLVSITLATLNVLQELCGNGLDLAMVRLAGPHAQDKPRVAASYYRSALQLKLLINGVIALAICLLAPQLAAGVFDNPDIEPLLKWVALGLIGASLYNYTLARIQAEERFSLYAVLRIANNIGKLVILGLVWLFDFFNPDSVLAAWILAFFIGYLLSLAYNAGRKPLLRESLHFESEYWKKLIEFGKWVVASSFLFSLYSRTDMLILARYSDTADIGHYAAAWNITYIIDLMTYSVIVALLPKATRIHSHRDFSAYLRSTFLICLLLAAMLMPLFFLSDWFFAVFFPAYSDAGGLFRILFAGALITLLFHPLYLILYARNRVNRLTLINLLLVIFCALLGLLVIPDYGATGAAWVTVSGRLFSSALICYFVYRELRIVFAGEQAQAS